MTAHAAAFGAFIGALSIAWESAPPPIVVLVAAALVGFIGLVTPHRSGMGVVLVALAAAGGAGVLGDRALDGLDRPAAGTVSGWVTLTSDPRPFGPVGVRAGGVWDGRRVSVTAHGPTAGRLDDALAGERVRIEGQIRPVAVGDDFARWRHEVGVVSVAEVRAISPGSRVTRLANGIRRVLARGVEGLGRDDRAVFLGMVLGDDREQTAVVADDFRAAGLGHLLVVSGQNVAFVIAVLMPLLVHARPGVRLVILVVALGFFALITRFEPSVLRAVVMAAVGVGAAAVGTPVDGRRALSAAVATLLLVDPFLAHVLAFRLSVAATGGIVWLGAGLADRLPGPQPLRVAIATTSAAQLGVAPLLVTTFGPMPLAALPANLLAGPASGPVMMWGCTAGPVAGLLGGWAADLIHLPTGILVGWTRLVAATAATAPQASIGLAGVVAVGTAVTVAVVAGRRVGAARPLRWVSVAAAAVVGCVVVAAAGSAPRAAAGRTAVTGAEVWSDGRVVVVALTDPPRVSSVLEAIRQAGVRRVDAIVATDGDAADARAVVGLHARYGEVPTFAPPLHRVPDASSLGPGAVVRIGPFRIGQPDPVPPGEPAGLVVARDGPP